MHDPRCGWTSRSNPHRLRARVRSFVLASGLVLASTGHAQALGPTSSPGAKISEADLAQSKTLYAAGLKALDARDYAAAQNAFVEAYRLAPHLHLFNYNIAVAAALRHDCRAAQKHYQAFLDLVPKHPERRTAQRALKNLPQTCPIDEESEAVLSPEDRARRDAEREQARAHEAMNDALAELRRGAAFYAALAKRFPDERVFKRAATANRKGAARMVKLLTSHEVDEVEGTPESPSVPQALVQACRVAKVQAGRTIDALERTLEAFDTKESIRVLQRLLRRADRDQTGFDACAG